MRGQWGFFAGLPACLGCYNQPFEGGDNRALCPLLGCHQGVGAAVTGLDERHLQQGINKHFGCHQQFLHRRGA